MSDTDINIKHVAKLARLELTADEAQQFTQQISDILGYVEQLQEVDVEGVEPTAHATHIVNVMRCDEVGCCQKLEATMANAPASAGEDDLIRVPKVLDDGGSA